MIEFLFLVMFFAPEFGYFAFARLTYIPALEQWAATLENPRAVLFVTFWCDISLILYPCSHHPGLIFPRPWMVLETPVSLAVVLFFSHRHLGMEAQMMSLDSASRAGSVCDSSCYG